MRFIERHGVVRALSGLLLLPMLAATGGCGDGTTGGGSPGGGGRSPGGGGTDSTTTAGGTGGTGMGGVAGAGGTGGTGTGGGGAPGGTPLVAVVDNVTEWSSDDPMQLLQNDLLTVFDPASPGPPLLELSGLKYSGGSGSRKVATSKSRKRLGLMEMSEPPRLRVFDENLQQLVDVVLPNDRGAGIYPTEQAIFALTGKGTISTGTIVKLDSNGSYVGSTVAFHGVDLVVDEDRQVVWSVGKYLTRANTELLDEQKFHTFGQAASSLDLDASGGVWAAEYRHPQIAGSVDQLVHFDVNGTLIGGDTLPLPGSPASVRVDRNSGLVWVAMYDAGVAYRDVNGQLNVVPGLTGSWCAVEPDPLDGSRVWAAEVTPERVVHVDTSGTVLQSLGGFSDSQKWLAVMLKGQNP